VRQRVWRYLHAATDQEAEEILAEAKAVSEDEPTPVTSSQIEEMKAMRASLNETAGRS